MPLPPLHRAVTSESPIAANKLRMLVLGSVVLAALMYAALSTYTLLKSRAQYEQRADLLTQNLAAATERALSANIEKVDFALTSLVDYLESQLATGALDMRAAGAHVKAQIARRPELEGMRVTDARGIAILGPGIGDGRTVNFADRDWFAAQRDRPEVGLFMSKPLVSKITGSAILSFSRRYRNPNGEFAGAVTAAVPLAYFQRLLEALDIGPHGSATLRDRDLGLITRFPVVAGAAGAVGSKQGSEAFNLAAANMTTQATIHLVASFDGKLRTITLRRLQAGPMIVAVGVSAEDYLPDWYGEVRSVAALCAGAVLLHLMASLLVLRLLAQNRLARQRIDLLAKVFEHSGEAIVVTDRDYRIVEVNPAFERQTGYPAAEVMGRDASTLASDGAATEQRSAVLESVRVSGQWRGELQERTKDGRIYPKWMSVTAVQGEGGEVSHHIASSMDITEVKRAEEKIVQMAHHDTLTSLPNRVHLQGRLDQALASARRNRSELGMLFIDMDRFKNVNDMFGHHVGDGLLVEIAQRLKSAVRDSDIVARLGGDEFVVALTGLPGDGARTAASIAGKLMSELSRPYEIHGHALHSTPSIGIAVFPSDGNDAQSLMKNADAAMYHAKALGRNNFQFFTQAMNQATTERLALEAGLRGAIERHELFLHYQPQLDLRSGQVVAVEALVRWQHPEMGLIPPLKFIPVAEETGQIEAIGAWVLDQALAQVARWRAQGFASLRVAVNLSPRQLRGNDFATLVAHALQRHCLTGDALELEITESAAMNDPGRTAGLLRQLRDYGVALAIDDFGTGYSSLAYLKQWPLSCLKLDRSFVMDIEHDANDAAISAATIQLAHNLGLAVVAEGLESAAQLKFLRGLECDMVQGYYISRPLAAADCTLFLQRSLVTESA
jgi:diguanylate cyclase (GGDEF)-like protein/PAS domain S-box-containing protein